MSSNIVIEAGEPRLAGTGIPVAAVVHACHEKMIGPGLAELAIAGLDHSTIEPVLTYCAERRCEADDATCPGCRLRTQKLGIQSLDEFVARHAEIRIEERDIRVLGPGAERSSALSLEALAKTWAGEEYWFWARRVLRKLRHGIRRAGRCFDQWPC